MMLPLLLVSALMTAAEARSKNFPPGWNGKARTPPM